MARFTTTGKALHDLALGLSVFAGTDNSLPAFTHVQLELSGTHVVGRATDRYRALIGTVQAREDVEGEFVALVSAKWLLSAGKSVKACAHVTVELSEPESGLRFVTVTGDGQTFTTQPYDAQFPGIEKLFDTFKPAETDSVAFNPAFMADIAKIPAKLHGGKSAGVAPLKLTLCGERKPALFTIESADVTWRGLLMPVILH